MIRRRASPGMRDRYQLRLLAERNRFYSPTTDLRSLSQRNLIAPTGQTDENGRAEWTITDAGRALLASIEP